MAEDIWKLDVVRGKAQTTVSKDNIKGKKKYLLKARKGRFYECVISCNKVHCSFGIVGERYNFLTDSLIDFQCLMLWYSNLESYTTIFQLTKGGG